jgi:hypothetical protein
MTQTEIRVPVAHASMQFSDNPAQKRADADKIFKRQRDRGAWWITGTEAGQEDLRDALRTAASRYGYRFFVVRDVWVGVDKDRITKGTWRTGYEHAIDSSAGVGKHTDKGVGWAQFDNADLGTITVGCAHYLTKGRPGAPAAYRVNLDENARLARVIGEWGAEHGKGNALVFYNGDQNIVDRTADTFVGQADFTSSWDELGRWENTGHGNIDVLASWDHDGRVSAANVRALDDREFHLHTDHYLVEGAFDVRALKKETR